MLVRNTKYRGVWCKGLIRASVHGHALGTLHICPDNRDVHASGVQHKLYNYWVGVAEVSVEPGFLVSVVLRVYNWGRITVRCTE